LECEFVCTESGRASQADGNQVLPRAVFSTLCIKNLLVAILTLVEAGPRQAMAGRSRLARNAPGV